MGGPKGKGFKARVLVHIYQGSLYREQRFPLVEFNSFEELDIAMKRVASPSTSPRMGSLDMDLPTFLRGTTESAQEIPSPSSLEDVLSFYGKKYGPRTNVRVMQFLLVD